MASNLSIAVRADTAEARAQLALVQADVKALGTALRQAAADARSGGGIGANDNLRQAAGQFEEARAKASALTKELNGAATEGSLLARSFANVKEEVERARSPIDTFRQGMAGILEVTGAAFAFEKISEWVEEITEGAERTKILAESLGTSSERLSEFQNISLLAGGESQNLIRIVTQLGHQLELGLNKPLSDQGQAIRAAGIDMAALKEALRDPIDTIELLRQTWQNMAGSVNRLDIFRSLVGPRGITQLAPVLSLTAEEFEKVKQAAEASGANLNDAQIEALSDTWEKVHELELAITGLKSHILLDFKEPIDATTTSLKAFVETITNSGAATAAFKSFFDAIHGTIDATKTDIDNLKTVWNAFASGWQQLQNNTLLQHLGIVPPANAPSLVPGASPLGLTDAGRPAAPAEVSLPEVSVTAPAPAGASGREGASFAGNAIANLSGNAAIVADALAKIGASANTVAGVLANLKAESGISPDAVNPSGATGIAQWTGDRLAQLKAAEGPAWNTLQGQVDFLVKELQGKFAGVFHTANRAADAASAAKIVYSGYEIPGSKDTTGPAREALATQIAAGGGVGSGTGSTAARFDPEAGRVAREQQYAELEAQIRQAEYQQDFAAARALLDKKLAMLAEDKASTASVTAEKVRLDHEEVAAAIQLAQQKYTSLKSEDTSYLAVFKANMAQLVAEHKISTQQAIGFEIEYTAKLYAEERRRLEIMMADDRLTTAQKQRLYDELVELDASYTAKISEAQAKTAQDTAKSWQESIKQVSDAFAAMATDVVLRTKSIGQAFDQLAQSLVKDTLNSAFKSLFSSALGVGGGSGGGVGGGIFDSLGKDIFGEGLAGAVGNPFSAGSGGLLGGLFGGASGAADQDFSGGIGAAADVGGGGLFSGLFGTLFKGLGSLFAFSKGGIVPSAAGGWAVPQLGPGGTLAQLHSNEMVLPANISQGLQGMIANGGGGNSFGININATDAASVQRLFMANGSALVAALNTAIRRGSMLTPG